MGGRQKVWPVLRVVVSVAMLGVLLTRVHLGSLFPAWKPSTMAWLGAAIAVTLAGVVLSAVRWRQVLDALGLRVALQPLVSHYFAGLFVGNFLPSTVGGDVLRVSRLSASSGAGPTTFASVVLERLTGWIVLPLLTLAGLAWNPSLLGLGAPSSVAIIVAATTLAALVTVLFFAAHPSVGGRVAHNEGWLRFVGAVHLGLVRMRHRPRCVLHVLAAGVTYQLAVVLGAFFAARALEIKVGWTAILAFMPAVAILQVLPLSIGGLGIREGALWLFLSPVGAGRSQAVGLGLLIYGVNLLVSLLGAPSFAVGGKRRVPA